MMFPSVFFQKARGFEWPRCNGSSIICSLKTGHVSVKHHSFHNVCTQSLQLKLRTTYQRLPLSRSFRSPPQADCRELGRRTKQHTSTHEYTASDAEPLTSQRRNKCDVEDDSAGRPANVKSHSGREAGHENL